MPACCITRGGFDHISGAVAGAPVALDWISKQLELARQPAANVVPLRPDLRRAA